MRPLKRNPASPTWRENTYYRNTSRGYFKRDAHTGKWRTPDGRIDKTQEKGRDGQWHSKTAVASNDRRYSRLLKIDAVNALRERGVNAKIRDVAKGGRLSSAKDARAAVRKLLAERRGHSNPRDRKGWNEITEDMDFDFDDFGEGWGDTP